MQGWEEESSLPDSRDNWILEPRRATQEGAAVCARKRFVSILSLVLTFIYTVNGAGEALGPSLTIWTP